ncbi:efflux transporter outer membrane subunit [Tanticharoenia sakaeratensis]|uniref:Outer membrane drug efflux protein n=1 Tax=Tanticharoenia sakaeratensis NBRC 103193 TaxID=1231623 RepID=A0A0D6MK30_9PROT|nr:efflux transporter outer membrane subunit [Tanticharoenia sakaeratensis]GAN53638.1 outer membrane drug efflux protein [Tanticharoenia sakaeratensis NBRC 103193]GBQ17312.1 secretion system type I outer membrane efflux pump lipoprotein NodT [Tanticharoenia sakaeratensis NBRC 103193]
MIPSSPSRPRSARRVRAPIPATTILLAAASMTTALSGCMVGPNYHRPAAITSQRFKEQPPPPGWQYAQPTLAEAPKGPWWEVFNDPQLDQLEQQVAISNQNVKYYEAAYRYAASMVDSVRAQLYPTVTGTFGFTRNSYGASSRANGGTTGFTTKTITNTWQTYPEASWSPDIWGKVRRQIQQQVTATQASAAELAAMTLSYQSTLAQDYFSLRYEDSLITLLDRNVNYYQQAYKIVSNQVTAGTADPTTALQARYQLESTRAQATQARAARAQWEHAIAVLVGKTPADLNIPAGALPDRLPAPPSAIPAVMLQRRPDIAEQERNMESANAEIGIDIAAFYPTPTLTAEYGYQGNPLTQLIQAGTQFWSLAASSSETIFNGGARTAAVRSAYAQYDEAVATYRQTVLTAFQDTENDLSNLRIYTQQLDQENTAVGAANEAVRVSMNGYLAGIDIYTTVITAQQNALTYEQDALAIREQLAINSVTLVTDLGGGWDPASLPTKNSLQTDQPLLPGFIQHDKQGARPASVERENGN